MRAAICHGAGDLRIEDFDPGQLGTDEVLVNVAFGGICGSDLHYFQRGAVGDFAVIKQPMVLGHEISGSVAAVGAGVSGLEPGMCAALDPSRACLTCRHCREGRSNLCLDMRFLGSAGRFPHVQGGFSSAIILRADQVIPVPQDTDLLALSCAEPLSVGLHAVTRAGNLRGKRVLVTGSGPIGLLTARSAIHAGASFVASTDIEDHALGVAKNGFGVDATVNVRTDPGGLAALGEFDVALEASGSPLALRSAFDVMQRGGRIVQVGMMAAGECAVPISLIQTREIDLVGAFRAHDEFRLAVDLIVSGKIDVTPILSGTFPLDRAGEAFASAGDRSKVVKLHLALS